MSKIINNLKNPNSYINILFNVIIYIGAYHIFNEMFLDCPSDLIAHLNIIHKIAKHEISIPANFLYYFSVWLFAGCSLIKSDLINAVLIILPISVVLKFVVTKYAILYINADINKLILNFAAFSLLIIMPIPYFLFINNAHYLGYLTPNVWHNSTTIFLMPFAILLFVESGKLLKQYSHNRRLLHGKNT